MQETPSLLFELCVSRTDCRRLSEVELELDAWLPADWDWRWDGHRYVVSANAQRDWLARSFALLSFISYSPFLAVRLESSAEERIVRSVCQRDDAIGFLLDVHWLRDSVTG